MLRNLPITIGAGSVSSSNRDIPSSMTGGNVHKRGCGWSALRLGNAQRVTLNLRVSLHPLHEYVATQIDLLAQSLPKALPHSVQNKAPIVLAGCLALSPELTLTQKKVHREPLRDRGRTGVSVHWLW